MTKIPEDIIKAGRRCYDGLGNESVSDGEHIARAILAEQERCAIKVAEDPGNRNGVEPGAHAFALAEPARRFPFQIPTLNIPGGAARRILGMGRLSPPPYAAKGSDK